jgi:hypothetical protein
VLSSAAAVAAGSLAPTLTGPSAQAVWAVAPAPLAAQAEPGARACQPAPANQQVRNALAPLGQGSCPALAEGQGAPDGNASLLLGYGLGFGLVEDLDW